MSENVLQPQRVSYEQLTVAVLGIAVLLSAAVVAWLLLRRETAPAVTAPTGGPALMTQAQLESAAAATKAPVYWAGARSGFSYELTITTSGRVFVRYLPDGVAAGDGRARFLTIGSYPDPHAFTNLERAARRPQTVSVGLDGGGLAVISEETPTSVYVAYPGAKYQVEVFDPSGDNARRIALSGSIKPAR